MALSLQEPNDRWPPWRHDSPKPNDPNKQYYDEDITVVLSDWYHNQSADIIAAFEDPKSYLNGNDP